MTLKNELDEFNDAMEDLLEHIYVALRIDKLAKWLTKLLKRYD